MLSSSPSFTLKVKLVYPVPLAFAGGTYLKLPASSWAFVTVCGTLPIAALFSCSSPLAGSVTIFTLSSSSPAVSAKLKSDAANA